MVIRLRSLSILGLILCVGAWRWHPVHAARVEVVATGRDVGATVRVYAEDFPPGTRPAAVAAYLAQTLRISDARGAAVVLAPQSITTEGDRLRIELRGIAPTSIGRGRIAVTLLQERFTDQVNVATVRIDGRRAQLVFLRGDAAQALP